jgi:hypothetical protein
MCVEHVGSLSVPQYLSWRFVDRGDPNYKGLLVADYYGILVSEVIKATRSVERKYLTASNILNPIKNATSLVDGKLSSDRRRRIRISPMRRLSKQSRGQEPKRKPRASLTGQTSATSEVM